MKNEKPGSILEKNEVKEFKKHKIFSIFEIEIFTFILVGYEALFSFLNFS